MNDKMDKEISELLLKNAFEEYENARCDEIIEKYKDTEPEYSEEHKRRMEKLFKKEKKSFCWGKFVKRAAMIILAVFLSGTLALQVEAVRIHIKNWYYEITEKSFYLGKTFDNLPSSSDKQKVVLSENYVEKYGFSLTQEMNDNFIMSQYQNINGTYVKCIQYFEKRNIRLDSDNSNYKIIETSGRENIIVYNDDKISIYWEEKENCICIHTNIGEDNIMELLESFVIK